jgi:CMP-N-acetylneuraminic acid synthetase/GT2 family glycosyltransferase
MRHPKVSVIVTAHNYAEFLEECLDSVLDQTYDNFELVVVDDGSTDETPEILREYSYEHQDIIKVVTLGGEGLPTACNRGIQAANGEYTIRLDADDYFDENILTIEASYLNSNENIDLVYPDYYTINVEGEILNHVRLPKVGEEVKLLDRSPLAAGAMYRREAWEEIDGYNESLDYQEDFDFWIKFISKFNVSNINLPLMYYRQHGSSMSTNFSERMNARRKVKREFVENELDLDDMEILGVIPARRETRVDAPDGSVKNLALKEVGKSPLISYSIWEGLASEHIDRLLVSTEDEEIAESARRLGAEVPFLRDEVLSSPTTQLSEVISSLLHRLSDFEEYQPDIIAILPYVAPLRTADQIDEAIDTKSIFSIDSVISVYESNEFLWRPGKYGLELLFEERLLREERETTYHENGAIYVTTPETVTNHNNLVGQHVGHIQMRQQNSVHINSWYDFQVCQHFIESDEIVGFNSSELAES